MLTVPTRLFPGSSASLQASKQAKPFWTRLPALRRPFAVLLSAVGLAIATAPFTTAAAVEVPGQEASLQAQSGVGDRSSAPSLQNLPDGVYLYGQSPEAEQIGSTYMVFAIRQAQVVGALYMPYSSFDCFRGEFQANQLAMTVVASYEQEEYPFAIALQPDTSVATTSGAVPPVGLEGFHRIASVSENDQRILATCQADLQPSR